MLLEGLALLTVGLVRTWGEETPRWLPFIGGRRVPVKAATAPGMFGAIVLTLMWVPFVVAWWCTEGDRALDPLAHAIVGLLRVPLAAWGPMLGVVAWSVHGEARPSWSDGSCRNAWAFTWPRMSTLTSTSAPGMRTSGPVRASMRSS